MTLRLVWLPEAQSDLNGARDWYDNIRPQLGHRFATAVAATVELIAARPLQFPVAYRNIRRAGIRRFPYSLFFEIQRDRILVPACFHGKRDPKHWQRP